MRRERILIAVRHIVAMSCTLTISLCLCSCDTDVVAQPAITTPISNTVDPYSTVSEVLLITSHAYGKAGSPQLLPNTTEGEREFLELLRVVGAGGYPLFFDTATVQRSERGYSVEIRKPLDPCGNRMVLWVEYTAKHKGELAIIVSACGANGLQEFNGWCDVGEDELSDDAYLYVIMQHAEVVAA